MSCGSGFIRRERTCPNGNNETEEQPCNLGDCVEFDQWSEWSSCSKTCKTERHRNCLNGNVGDPGCTGPADESKPCTMGDCGKKYGLV